MRRALTIIASAGLLWGLGLTGAASADETRAPTPCEQAQAAIDANREAREAALAEAEKREEQAKLKDELAAEQQKVADAADAEAADQQKDADKYDRKATRAQEDANFQDGRAARQQQKADEYDAKAAKKQQKADEARAAGNTEKANELAAEAQAARDKRDQARAEVADAIAKRDAARAKAADFRAKRDDARAAAAAAIEKRDKARSRVEGALKARDDARASAKEARAKVKQLDTELNEKLIPAKNEACDGPGADPPGDDAGPSASITGEACESGGVGVLLDNSGVEQATEFTIVSAFGSSTDTQTVTVSAGETKNAVAPAPTDIQGTITVKANGELLVQQAGTLICGADGDGSGFPPDDGKVEVQPQGSQLPFTGSPLRLIGLIAVALIAAGAATLGGLRLARHRS